MPTNAMVSVGASILALLAGCSPSEQQQTGDGLRSDMPLRETAYYVENERARVDMQVVCEKWKGSQRPIASWPSVVTSNCDNVDTAKQLVQSKKDREAFKKGMGL